MSAPRSTPPSLLADVPSSGAAIPPRDRRWWVVTLAAVLVLVACATYVNLRKSIWLDEALTLDRTQTSVPETLRFAREVSTKPPLYFLLVYWWRLIDRSLEWTRVLSTLFMAFGVLAFAQLSRLLRIDRGVLGLAVIATLTPHFIWAAAEARVYALSVFLLTSCILLFVRVWIVGSDHRNRDTVLFVLAAYAALMTFYYSGFVLAALFAAGLLYPGRPRLVASGVAIAVLMIPQALVVMGQVDAQSGSYLPPVPLGHPSAFVQWLATEVTEVIHRNAPFYGGDARRLAFAAALAGIVGVRLVTARGRLTREEWWALAFGGLALVFVGGLRALNKTNVDTRHWIVVAPPLLLGSALAASRLRPAWLGTAALGGLTLSLGLGAASFVRTERGSADWKRPAQWINAEQRAHEPVISVRSHALPIKYYYRGPNVVYRFPADTAIGVIMVDGKAHLDTVPPDEVQRLRALVADVRAPDFTFWIVERESPLRGPEVLSEYLGQEVRVLERRTYFRVRAYRVQLTAPLAPPAPAPGATGRPGG